MSKRNCIKLITLFKLYALYSAYMIYLYIQYLVQFNSLCEVTVVQLQLYQAGNTSSCKITGPRLAPEWVTTDHSRVGHGCRSYKYCLNPRSEETGPPIYASGAKNTLRKAVTLVQI